MTVLPARTTAGQVLAVAGTGAVGVGIAAVALLHLLAPDVSPIRQTISEYMLGGHADLFGFGVLALAAGSAAVLGALVRAGVVRASSLGVVFLAMWVLGLVVTASFEKVDWSVGPTPEGLVHRYASLVAFLALSFAGLAIGRRWRRDATWGARARWVRRLGWASLAWWLPIFGWFTLRSFRVGWFGSAPVPLGLLERGLALTEVAVVVALGLWAMAATRIGRT